MWTPYVTITGSSPPNGEYRAPRWQVVPLVLSSVLLGLLVFSVFGPDRSATIASMEFLVVFLVWLPNLSLHVFAGVWAWNPYTIENPQGMYIRQLTTTKEFLLWVLFLPTDRGARHFCQRMPTRHSKARSSRLCARVGRERTVPLLCVDESLCTRRD